MVSTRQPSLTHFWKGSYCDASSLPLTPFFLHACEQYFTSSQHLAHFLRHVNGRRHTRHFFSGKLFFWCVITPSHSTHNSKRRSAPRTALRIETGKTQIQSPRPHPSLIHEKGYLATRYSQSHRPVAIQTPATRFHTTDLSRSTGTREQRFVSDSFMFHQTRLAFFPLTHSPISLRSGC